MAIVIIAIAVLGLGVTFWYSSKQTISHQTDTLAKACGALANDVAQLYPSNDERQVRVGNPDLLHQQMQRISGSVEGAEGGFWHISNQFFGYAFPTYLGSDIRTDVAKEDTTLLRSLSQRALEQQQTVVSVQRNQFSALLAVACPMETHESLAAWFMHRTSLVPLSNTILTGGLFLLLGLAGVVLLLRALRIEKHWYQERDRLVAQAEDESKPVPVTSNINEVQPLLMLLYRARQQQGKLERTIGALEAKLYRNQELSLFGRFSTSFTKELKQRLHHWKLAIQPHEDDHAADIDRIEKLLVAFENLDLKEPSSTGNASLQLDSWLTHLAADYQHRVAKDQQSVTAICTQSVMVTQNYLLLRFVLDTLVAQAINYGPEAGEVLIKATPQASDDNLTIEVIDESQGLPADKERLLFRQDDVLPSAYGEGLKLVRDAVHNMGGELSYASDGENSRFIVQIPMTSE